MPYIDVQYSRSLADRLDISAFVDGLYDAALRLDVFPRGGVRIHAVIATHSRVGDDNPRNGFVQIRVRIAPGRSEDVRRRVMNALFDAASLQLTHLFEECTVGLQIELGELDSTMTKSRNSLIEEQCRKS